MSSERDLGYGLVIAGKTLLALIYFKVCSAFIFENGLTLVGALVTSVVFAVAEEFVFAKLMWRLRSPLLFRSPAKLPIAVAYFLLFLLAVPATILLAVGFSPATVGFSERTATDWFTATAVMLAGACLTTMILRYCELRKFYRLPGR